MLFGRPWLWKRLGIPGLNRGAKMSDVMILFRVRADGARIYYHVLICAANDNRNKLKRRVGNPKFNGHDLS